VGWSLKANYKCVLLTGSEPIVTRQGWGSSGQVWIAFSGVTKPSPKQQPQPDDLANGQVTYTGCKIPRKVSVKACQGEDATIVVTVVQGKVPSRRADRSAHCAPAGRDGYGSCAGVLVCSRPLPPRRARNPAVHKGNPAARRRGCIISLDEVSAAAVRDRITSGWDDLSTVPPAIGLTCGVHWSFRFV
jgi:hypothetical protein